MTAKRLSLFIRILITFSILASILIIFYSKIVMKDYEIIENPDGPTLDE